jgi:hypothetical protein
MKPWNGQQRIQLLIGEFAEELIVMAELINSLGSDVVYSFAVSQKDGGGLLPLRSHAPMKNGVEEGNHWAEAR